MHALVVQRDDWVVHNYGVDRNIRMKTCYVQTKLLTADFPRIFVDQFIFGLSIYLCEKKLYKNAYLH